MSKTEIIIEEMRARLLMGETVALAVQSEEQRIRFKLLICEGLGELQKTVNIKDKVEYVNGGRLYIINASANQPFRGVRVDALTCINRRTYDSHVQAALVPTYMPHGTLYDIEE